MPNLRDKVAVITGASSGIGAATAVHFASLGCNLSLTARNQTKLEKVVQECLDAGLKSDQVLVILGDITEKSHSENLIQKTVDHFGRLDILINNAGVYRSTPVDSIDFEDFDFILNTNFKAAFRLLHLSVPHLKLSKGNVVNMSSFYGDRPGAKCAAYCASKASMDQLSKVAALELGAYGVRVNSINPGFIETDFHENSGFTEKQTIAFRKVTATSTVLKRNGKAEEIAKPIAFLASDDASFVTGTCFTVDGGLSLTTAGLTPRHNPITNSN